MSDLDDDDYPSTHLDDDDYDEFLAREFDGEGRLRDGPPVTRLILGLIAVVLLLALLLFF